MKLTFKASLGKGLQGGQTSGHGNKITPDRNKGKRRSRKKKKIEDQKVSESKLTF